MRAWEFLTESFDSPYPYRWDVVVPNEIIEVVFKTDSGDDVVVEIERYGEERLNKWELGFYRNGEQDVTGEGDAMRIFATVIKIIQEFIQKHKPNSISFTAAKKESESLDNKGSRQKLYSRMVKRFAGSMGYNVKEQSDIYQSFFTLTKKGLRFKNDFMAESFDQPYPVKLTKEEFKGQYGAETDYRAIVPLPDGTELVIEFGAFDEEDGNPVWTMEFDRDGNNNITGEGDAMRIFATVIEAIRQFINQEKPYKFGFAAYKPRRSTRTRARNKSRSKLYTRMVKRFASQMGYQVDIKDSNIDTDFMLTNPSYKKTDQDLTESFDSPYAWKWTQAFPSELTAEFNTDSGDLVEVLFETSYENPDEWVLEFFRNDASHTTGQGDALRIFATVLDVVKAFIHKKDPETIEFTAEKKHSEWNSADLGSRQKLYTRMVNRFASSVGYDAHIKSELTRSEFLLTRKD